MRTIQNALHTIYQTLESLRELIDDERKQIVHVIEDGSGLTVDDCCCGAIGVPAAYAGDDAVRRPTIFQN